MRWMLKTGLIVMAGAMALAFGHLAARADGGSCAAYLSGLETSKKTPVELVVLNTTGVEMTLDLRLFDKEGNVVLDRPGGVVAGPRAMVAVSLEAELARDLPKKVKPYSGLVAIELSGDPGFRSETAIVHATQYFGKRNKPRGAAVFRALFRDETE
jgi:hypothetical protein